MAELTGRHVLAITVGAFSVIIAVNLVMAWKAVATFPGLDVPNSYVASQEFDARRRAQEALGWTMQPAYDRGRMTIAFTDATGRAVEVASLEVLIGRLTEAKDDVTPDFTYVAGQYEAEVPLAAGTWMVRVKAIAADGTLFEQRKRVTVGG
ncbi:FixH family protein [Rhodobacter sp. Har01]|uniref:FixH family protein n=1 Tax=Rhodobacter sp. Har01 TaxID=2883999 RepID=UPI001D06F607|nr:FixH family protein [Rhodobacter sp. Har01]MCB6179573.1 FixH family protein [Rhodobacter sp. Har01]